MAIHSSGIAHPFQVVHVTSFNFVLKVRVELHHLLCTFFMEVHK